MQMRFRDQRPTLRALVECSGTGDPEPWGHYMFKEIGRRFRRRRGEGAAHEGKEKSILLLILKKKKKFDLEKKKEVMYVKGLTSLLAYHQKRVNSTKNPNSCLLLKGY